jgi:hypothetical protein
MSYRQLHELVIKYFQTLELQILRVLRVLRGEIFRLDLLGFTTAMDGGRDCSRQSSAFPPSTEVRSAGAAESGSSNNLEELRNISYGCCF